MSPPKRADRVVRAEDRCDARADLAQDAVAGRVAEALVDDLEPVDVEQQDRDRLAAPRRPAAAASASTTRWMSVSRVGRPVTGSRGESACSWSRAFSRAIEASWANFVSASTSGCRKTRSVVPDARPSTPTTRPPTVSGTPTHRADLADERGERALEGVVVVDDERLAGPEHLAADALVDRQPEADVVGHDADRRRGP